MHHNFLFDLDQTILDFHATEKKALEIVARNNGLTYSEDVYTSFKAFNKSLWLRLEKGEITKQQLFEMRFKELIRLCKGESLGLDPAALNDEFIDTMAKNGIPMEGALEFIDRIKREIKGARIYIVTNGATKNALGRIRSTGLDKYLDDVFVCEAMGTVKPEKKYFDLCLEKIAEPKETCIVIDDSLTSDMQGAKNAGMTSVWFMPEGNAEEAKVMYDIDYTASSFDELFEILKKL